jgi:peptidoglycan/LPS O-acetylase OafA/YrhL
MKRVEFLLTLWLVVATVATFITLPHWLNSLLIPMWASLFTGGCYLYLIRSRGATKRRLITFAASVVLSMYWSLQYQSVYTQSTALGTQLTVLTIVLVSSAVLLLIALRKWALPRSRLWMWLGCLAYPIYLTHATAGQRVYKALGGAEWPRLWLVLALVLLVSMVLAVVVERRICPAFHKLLDRTAQRVLEKLGLRQEPEATAMR